MFSSYPIMQEKEFLEKKAIALILGLGNDHYFPLLIRKFIVHGDISRGKQQECGHTRVIVGFLSKQRTSLRKRKSS